MKRKLITTDELSEFLQVTNQTIYRWRKEGLPFKQIGRSIRFNLEEVLEWIDGKDSLLTPEEMKDAIEIISSRSSLINTLNSSLENIDLDNSSDQFKKDHNIGVENYKELKEIYNNYYEKWISKELSRTDYNIILVREKMWEKADQRVMENFNDFVNQTRDKELERKDRKISRSYDDIKEKIERNKFFRELEGNQYVMNNNNNLYLDVIEEQFIEFMETKDDFKEMMKEVKNQEINIMFLATKNENGAYVIKENTYMPGRENRFKGSLEEMKATAKRSELWEIEKKKRQEKGE